MIHFEKEISLKIFNPHLYQLPTELEEFFNNIYEHMCEKFNCPKYEIELSVISEEEIRELNKNYRNKDKETDVLSFPMKTEENELFLGAIYFCYSVIKKNNPNLLSEFSFLFIHSFLHLLGHEHGEHMFQLQEEIFSHFF